MRRHKGLGVPAHPDGGVDHDRGATIERGSQQSEHAIEQDRHVCLAPPNVVALA
jgi:hypothetical protein